MTDNNWKNNLKVLADQLRAEQKNKKGTESKFDKVVGYKNKKGFNPYNSLINSDYHYFLGHLHR